MSLPSYRCDHCNSTSENARNLVVFIDGTSNKPGNEETNVVKMRDVVPERGGSEIQQKKLYLAGIGVREASHSSPPCYLGTKVSSGVEMAFACNVKENVKRAYSWLAHEYQKGDRIYLFGFSRGAYQVRALAGMIHEVGLMKLQEPSDQTDLDDGLTDPPPENNQARIDEAYRHYRCINSNDANPRPRDVATKFKKDFCWPRLKVHFVGVWDTVSSLGLIKHNVHVTASSSVTNACHFRHALALDERRVKFIPEYFREVNAHPMVVKSPRSSDSDVKEVWFAGHHSDIGGTSRQCSGEGGPHAGRVSLLWMTREATVNGLVFEAGKFSWDPEDVRLGKLEEVNLWWRILEILPIRHQVGFSPMGKHVSRWHLFHPRSVIPHQHLHPSVLSGDVYAPRATLCAGVGVPMVSRVTSGGLWTIESLNEDAATLLRDPHVVLSSLEKVSFLLDFMLDNEQIRTRVHLSWGEEIIRRQHHFGRFALAVIYDVASGFSMPEELLGLARKSLCAILSSSNQPRFSGIDDILRISTRHETLGQHFISHEEVIRYLMVALDRAVKDGGDDLFIAIMDCLCYLINDVGRRNSVIDQLTTQSDGHPRLLSVLEVKAPDHLTASLRMIAFLGQYAPALCDTLKPKIIRIAKKERGPVGSAAVGVLIGLKGPIDHTIHFSNLLGYFDSTLPRLDAEIGSTSQTEDIALPPVFPVSVPSWVDEELIHELVQPFCVQRRTVATLTLLKLCRDPNILDRCLQDNILGVFLKQMDRKETSLLAAYALKMLLAFSNSARHPFAELFGQAKLDEWTSDDVDILCRTAQLITGMFDKGWFDDAVGQVEGFEIFRKLMSFDNLRQKVIKLGILSIVITKFAGGARHDVRMSRICLDVLGNQVIEKLDPLVIENLAHLRHKRWKTGVKVLSNLALTEVGEKAVRARLDDIVKMLLPRDGELPVARSQLFGPTAVLHNFCKNETLREDIKKLFERVKFEGLRKNSTLYPPIQQKRAQATETNKPFSLIKFGKSRRFTA